MSPVIRAGVLILCAGCSQAQNVVSAKAGLIIVIQGSVYLDSQLLAPSDKAPKRVEIQMKNHQVLRTEAGGASAVTLSPQVAVSLLSNSEFRIDNTSLDLPQATLVRGVAEISNSFKPVRGKWPIQLRVGEALIELQGAPKGEIDADVMQVWVTGGQIAISANGKEITLTGRQHIDLRTLTVSKFNPRDFDLPGRARAHPAPKFAVSIPCVAGGVYLDDQKLMSSPGIELRYLDLPRMEEGQTLRIVKGWAELELRYSRLRAMDDTVVRLGDQEVVLEHGTLVGGLTIPTRAPAASKIPFPPFRFGDTSIQFLGNDALFELGNPEGLLRVYRGEAVVQAHGKMTRIPKKSVVNLSGRQTGDLVVGRLDPKKDPPLYSFPGLVPNYFASEMQVGPQQPALPDRCGP